MIWNIKLILLILFISPQKSLNLQYSADYVKNLIESYKSLAPLEREVILTEIATVSEIITKEIPGSYNEDVYLNISQLVTKYGYGFEEHRVITEDGYILTLHRIPGNGPPVYVNHGILLSSDDFVTAGPESALAYYLASNGYDVWLGNARGNKHSRNHISLSPEQPEFWDFSWDEVGRYDLPVSIDYILGNTGFQKLYYIGYSQGNTALYVLCSEHPEYNEKIVVAAALAPVAWFSHLFSPVLRFFYKINVFETLIALRQPKFSITFLSNLFCGNDSLSKFLCSNLLFLGLGFDRAQINITNLPVIFSHTPNIVASKQFLHYKQSFLTGKFRKFDYGETRNIELYGSKTPPDYRVNNTRIPLALFYSDSDFFSSVADVATLVKNLPNVVRLFKLETFNHFDFLFGLDAKNKVNVRIVDLFRMYSKYG